MKDLPIVVFFGLWCVFNVNPLPQYSSTLQHDLQRNVLSVGIAHLTCGPFRVLERNRRWVARVEIGSGYAVT